MHHKTLPFALTLLALAAHAQAQDTQRITITGSASPQAPSVAGFGDIPLWRTPFSATVIDQRQLRDAGISSLGDITRLDAAFTDAYNAPGYWNQVAVRGYTLDNRYNYRRDGLPVNAETVIGQANKQSLEVLRGTSGLQAGTSAPGGLLNLVVKRPRDRIRDANLAWTQDGTLEAAVDVGDRNDALGWRVNASAARLDPQLRASRGDRWLFATALDARLGADTFAEAEFEILYNQGINKQGNILDVGINHGVVEKKGAWLQFNGELIGQGKDAARQALVEKPDLGRKIVDSIMARRTAAVSA